MPQLEQLQFFISQAFWLVLVFTAIYLFTAYWFIPRVGGIVESRRNKIESDTKLAEELKSEIASIENKVNKMLEEARAKGSEIKLSAIKNSDKDLQGKMAKFEKDLLAKSSKDEERLSRFKSQLQSEVGTIAENLGNQIFNLVVKKK